MKKFKQKTMTVYINYYMKLGFVFFLSLDITNDRMKSFSLSRPLIPTRDIQDNRATIFQVSTQKYLTLVHFQATFLAVDNLVQRPIKQWWGA
jgi:hypothetical protein